MQPFWIALFSFLVVAIIGRKGMAFFLGEHPKEPDFLKAHPMARRCQTLETLLTDIRTHQVSAAPIPLEWLEIVLNGTETEFLNLICTAVWGSQGREFYNYRLMKLADRPQVFWAIKDLSKAVKE